MMAPKRKKKVNIVVKDSAVMNSIKRSLGKLGCEVLSDVKKMKDSDFVIFDPYFLELGLINVLKKENPLSVLLLVGTEEEIRSLGQLPCLCFCDKIVLKKPSNHVGKEIAEWFLENYQNNSKGSNKGRGDDS